MGKISHEAMRIDAPCTATEKVIAEIWSEVLEIDKIGIHDNFFRLGGHSLLGTRVIASIREIFQIELALNKLFEAPTIDKLAQEIGVQWDNPQIVETIALKYLQLQQMTDDEINALLTD